MMKNLFDNAVEVVFMHEGGYVFDKNDPGGETRYGISKRSYPDLNIKLLEKTQARDIYQRDYWHPLRMYLFDNANICLEIFDMAVNAGIYKAVTMVQKLARVKEDGIIGGITAGAVNNYKGDIVKDYKHARIIYYVYLTQNNKSLTKFLKGWKNRVNSTYFINL